MRILLDTHCWLWMHAQPERLGRQARQVIEEVRNERFLSAASAWEIAIKYALGRLPLPQPPGQYLSARLPLGVTLSLPVTQEHAVRVAELPAHHRDPFDRLLVAQCQAERLYLLTADSRFKRYDVEIIWAT